MVGQDRPSEFAGDGQHGLRVIGLGSGHDILPTPYSLLPTPYSLLPTPYSLLPAITLNNCAFPQTIPKAPTQLSVKVYP
ncbi:MAG: hypothetical protein F6J94_32630 [Moorea sp. SIO1F2]|uniref:hypothetical protein n=1 Tax=Moorena sp. SIO1F2 TaxID=2607819 RepID=UPI0013B9D62A|nr:hypothetical protein [Moorena sp. SIO1F2]